MVKNIKLNTFFFKEYVQIAEKNTYSAYIPNGNRGIWCIADFEEKIYDKKQENIEIDQKIENNNIINKKNVKRKNLAKAGVHKVIEKYLENSSFSIENMKKIIQSSKDKVIFEKSKFFKVEKNNEKYFDSKDFYSQIVIIIDKEDMIVGNMGKTELALYRENKIIEKIRGEEIKKIKLQKNDYLLVGSSEFWKNINENEIEEVFVNMKSKENIEKNLSNKVKIAERKLKKVIPFLSIFVENIENEDNKEELKREIENKNQKNKIAVKYIFLAAIFALVFVSVGKNIQNRNIKTQREKNIKNVIVKKISEQERHLKNNLAVKMEVEKNRIGNKNTENIEEKSEDARKNEIEKTVVSDKKVNKNIKNLKTVQNTKKIRKNIKNRTKKTRKIKNRKVRKKIDRNKKYKDKRYGDKRLSVNNNGFRSNSSLRGKSDKFSQLEKEIEQNWEILGRDRNGNDMKRI